MGDFHLFYASADALGQGENPYDLHAVQARWQTVAPRLAPIDMPPLAAPPTVLLIAPLVHFTPEIASAIWLGLSVLGVLAIIACTLNLAGCEWTEPSGLTVAACILLLGPVQVGVLMGQASTLSIACLFISMALVERGRSILGGLALGLAIALKPQIGGLLVVYLLLQKQWRASAVGLILFGSITAIAVAWLGASGHPWLRSWIDNIHLLSSAGAVNSIDVGNATRDHLMQLQVILMPVFGQRRLADILAWLIAAGLAVVYLRIQIKTTEKLPASLSLPVLLGIGCLPIYHRYYDSAFLAMMLAWLVMQWRREKRFGVMWLALGLVPFLLPVGWPTNLVRKGYISIEAAQSTWWNALVVSAPALSFLLVVLIGLWTLGRYARSVGGAENVDNAFDAA